MTKTLYTLLENHMLSCLADSAHDREHIYRVLYLALDIAETEPDTDLDVLIAACLLHDIGRPAQQRDPRLDHAEAGAELAYNFLKANDLDEAFAAHVRSCIRTHRFRKGDAPASLEAEILFDADKLDVCGATGIARTLQYGGSMGEPLYLRTPDGAVSNGTEDRDAADDSSSFFGEYHFKLEKLYDRFLTARGAELAQARKTAAAAFYEALLREVREPEERGKARLAAAVPETETPKQVLKRIFGYDSFRTHQKPVVDALLNGQDVLCVMPTGAGKSVCYQVPALLLPGVTLVVSPLISLMKDQVNALTRSGVPAAYLNSSLTPRQHEKAMQNMLRGDYKLVYVAPERLLTPGFLDICQRIPISMLAVDEAHCVSQWGQDFRPHYLEIADFLDALSERPTVGAFTATATGAVREDIRMLLRLRKPLEQVSGYDRPNLFFCVERPFDRDARLIQLLREREGRSGIVYCMTRKKVEELTERLRGLGFPVTRYHAGLTPEERQLNQEDFLFDRKPVMIATNAFGMGINKSNVSFVIHAQMPKSPEAYYQEAGRAGRDGEPADCILLYAPSDIYLNEWMISHNDLNPSLTDEQQAAVLEQDKARLKAMTDYATGSGCLRNTLLRYFGETADRPCGACSRCAAAAKKSSAAKKPTAVRSVLSAAEAPVAARSVPTPQEAGETLLSALKTLRTKIAREEHIPPFWVFSDAVLSEMSRIKPRTREELLQVSGVGSAKQKRYGDRFLAEIRRFTHPESQTVRKSSGSEKPKEVPDPPPAYRWTDTALQELRADFSAGLTVSQAAQKRGCTLDDITEGLKKLS